MWAKKAQSLSCLGRCSVLKVDQPLSIDIPNTLYIDNQSVYGQCIQAL